MQNFDSARYDSKFVLVLNLPQILWRWCLENFTSQGNLAL